MYRASFKIDREEPEVMYFTAWDRFPKEMNFKVTKKEPIVFRIFENKLEME